MFDEWQVELTKFLGDYMDYDKITVSFWCQTMNSYDRYREVQNAENNNLINTQGGRRQDR